jgi:hypothetical protein
MTFVTRQAAEVDALVTDRYLESLLAAYEWRASETPSDVELDPTVRLVAARLGADLIRVHPSFRFEERLAGRLAQVGQRLALAAAPQSQDEPEAAPFDLARRIGLEDLATIDLLDPARPESPGGLPRRPLLIGGTLASAALSIAGAAIVAWRLRRPTEPLAGTANATDPLAGTAGTVGIARARDERVSLA